MILQKSLFKLAFLIFLFFLISCTTTPPDQAKVERAIELFTDTRLHCRHSPPTGCFQDSPYKELVKEAFSSKADSSKHFVNILNYGDDAIIIRAHLIRSARKSIHLQTFIWGKDESSSFFNRELLRAARRGVKVKVLVDQLGLLGKGPRLEFGAVAHKNLEIKIYNPILNKAHTNYLEMAEAALFNFGDFNQRMHNKVMIVDGQIGLTGGRNIEDKYFDLDSAYNFKDREILVVGPVAEDMNRSFQDYWNYEKSVSLKNLTDVGRKIIGIRTTKPIRELMQSPVNPKLMEFDEKASDFEFIKKAFSSKSIGVKGRIEFFADSPGKRMEDSDSLFESTLQKWEELFQQARKSVIIQTPYLVFSRFATKKLEQLREQFPDINIIISTNSLASTDNIATYGISYPQKKHLLKNLKFQIYEFKPNPGDVRQIVRRYNQLIAGKNNKIDEDDESFNELRPEQTPGPRVGIHGKSFVLDDEIAWIGSHNFDPRSENINTEAALVIWDQKVAHNLKINILHDIEPQNSWVVAKREKLPILSYFTGFLETFSIRLPIVDIWPFYYFTSYELRPGKQPVSPNHPDFHNHFKAVGPFPKVNLSLKAIQSRLIKAMGGLATPII